MIMKQKMRQDPPLTYKQFNRRLRFSYVVVIFAISFLLILAIYGQSVVTHNTGINENRAFATLMYSDGAHVNDVSTAARTKRISIAQNLLQTYDALYTAGIDSPVNLNRSEWRAVSLIALSGDPVLVDTQRVDMSGFFTDATRGWWLFAMFCLFSLPCLYIYAVRKPKMYFFADLPWRKPWLWLWVVLFGPLGWMCLMISANKMRKYKSENEFLPPPTSQPPAAFSTDLTKAREAYGAIRNLDPVARKELRLTQIDTEICDIMEELEDHSEAIDDGQRAINDLRAERLAIEDAGVPADAENDQVLIDQEFGRLMTLPGVIAAETRSGRLCLIIRASTSYMGTAYDLGDWELWLSDELKSLVVNNIRPGTISGDQGLYGMGGGFCFGSRRHVINMHIAKGQYLEAVALATESISTVNRTHRGRIPAIYLSLGATGVNGQGDSDEDAGQDDILNGEDFLPLGMED
jgi:hypothetical protein